MAMMGAVAAGASMPLHASLAAGTWIGIGGVAALFYKMTGARPRFGRIGAADAGWSALAGIGLALAGSGALAIEVALVPQLESVFARKEAFHLALLRPDEPAFIPVVLLVVAVGPAICEEVLFRGVFRAYLERALSRTGRVITLAVLFSLLHGDVTVLLPMTYVGAMLTVIAERTGGWIAAAVAHFVLNAFSALVWSRLVGDAEVGLWLGAVILGVGASLATLAVARTADSGRAD